MGLFEYKAVNKKGKSIKGIIEADSISFAQNILQKKSLLLTHIKKHSVEKNKIRIKKADLFLFTNELYKLISAGIPLYGSINALKEKYEKGKIHLILSDISDQLKKGVDFSKALERYPDVFDIIYISMIKNAEKTGFLERALEQLVDILKKSMTLKKKVISALLYPGILTIFCFVVIYSLLFYVLPSLFDLFDGKNLHPLTKFILGISKFFVSHKIALHIGIILFFSFSIYLIYFSKIKEKVYKYFFKVKYIKDFLLKLSVIRFSRSFSVLLGTNIEYIEALYLAKKLMKNPFLEKDIDYAEKKVIEGEKLSKALKERKNFPLLMIRMLEVAEESGKISDMMKSIANIYEEDLEKTMLRLTALLQPILLLFLGLVVGVIVLAVLLPMIDVNSFIS